MLFYPSSDSTRTMNRRFLVEVHSLPFLAHRPWMLREQIIEVIVERICLIDLVCILWIRGLIKHQGEDQVYFRNGF